jgi:HAE1 family hydrophobic/amphiphilic exporter-1
LTLLPVVAPAARAQETPPAETLEASSASPTSDGNTISTLIRDEQPPSGIASGAEGVPLSLDDAIMAALQRNLGLVIERYERAQFRLRLDESLGIFDLNLDAQAFHEEETSPATSRLVGAEVVTTEQSNLNVQPTQLTPWGGLAGLTFNIFRRETNSRDAILNPLFFTDVDATFTQPLLRNFGRLATERGIRIARLNSEISREVFEQQVSTTLRDVENAYWNLVEAREQVEVARESLSLARELHQMNRVRVDVGTLAPLDLVTSETGIATREEQIILAEAAVQQAEDELRRLMHLEQGELWEVAIVPTTPAETERAEIDLQQAIATAMTERPELQNQKLRNDILDLESRFFRNQLLPRLDLTTRYGYNGIGGDIRDEQGQVIVPGGLSDALQQVTDRDFDGWRVDLTFGYPLQNRAARARKVIADLDRDQGHSELVQLEQDIIVEVRAAVRGVRTAAQQIESTRASRGLAERQLDAERKRYENGLSTSFQVLEIQEDLTAARSREVAAIAGYRRALAEYWRATGRLLEEEGVEFTDPLSVEESGRFGWGIADVDE